MSVCLNKDTVFSPSFTNNVEEPVEPESLSPSEAEAPLEKEEPHSEDDFGVNCWKFLKLFNALYQENARDTDDSEGDSLLKEHWYTTSDEQNQDELDQKQDEDRGEFSQIKPIPFSRVVDMYLKVYNTICFRLKIDPNADIDFPSLSKSKKEDRSLIFLGEWGFLLDWMIKTGKHHLIAIVYRYFIDVATQHQTESKLIIFLTNFLNKLLVYFGLSTEEQPETIVLTEKQREILNSLMNSYVCGACYSNRAAIILLTADGFSNHDVSNVKNRECHVKTVRKWVQRWLESSIHLAMVEEMFPRMLKKAIMDVLSDAYRSGRPSEFTPEQIVAILSEAMKKPPKELVRTHWSYDSLTEHLISKNIVEGISRSSVRRFLKEFALNISKVQLWLNPQIKDQETFNKIVKEICYHYKEVEALAKQGIRVLSIDEMCGIQALEHKYKIQPARPGKLSRLETKYIRNGVTGILGVLCVTSGQVKALVQRERKEVDFEALIKMVLEELDVSVGEDGSQQRYEKMVIIADNLNTHKSASLVKLIAKHEGIDLNTLGEKGKRGILKSLKSREEFLSAPERKIRFLYTPINCSWMNQIEIWFSIIKRRILTNRASYTSIQELEERIRAFIDYYNEHLAKKINWNYNHYFRTTDVNIA